MLNSCIELFSFDPKKHKKVLAGIYLFDSFIFRKEVKPRHFMVKENGYGISEDIIQQLIHLGCDKIQIQTKKNLYEFSFESLLNQPIKDYGHGSQRFLKIIKENK